MADGDSGGGPPTIRTGDIQTAEFTVNKYVVRDGEVVREEVEADLDDDEMADFEAEIETEMDEAMSEMDRTGRVPDRFDLSEPEAEPGTEPTSETEEPEPDPEPTTDEGDTSLDQIAAQTESDEDFDTPLVAGRTIAEENDITKYDFPQFAAAMRDRGDYDQDTISEVWSDLRDEDSLTAATEEDKPGSAGGDDGDDSGGATDNAESRGESDDGPEEMFPPGQDVLLIREGSASSARAAEALQDPMLQQDVLPIPITSDMGEDLLEPLDNDVSTPIYLVAQADESFEREPLEDIFEQYL